MLYRTSSRGTCTIHMEGSHATVREYNLWGGWIYIDGFYQSTFRNRCTYNMFSYAVLCRRL